jgi:ATP/maltotriose-dependent transcriptional regulator MalT
LDETKDNRVRARLLAAFVEVLLRTADVDSADEAARELQIIATHFDSAFLRATSNYSTASVLIARGEERQALPLLRQSFDAWRELEAPYEEARTRLFAARARFGVENIPAVRRRT